jgi:hypothetical protein
MDSMIFDKTSQPIGRLENTEKNGGLISFTGPASQTDKIRISLNQLDLTAFDQELLDLGNISPEFLPAFPAYNAELCEENKLLSIIIANQTMVEKLTDQLNEQLYYQPTIISNRTLLKPDLQVLNYIALQKHFGAIGIKNHALSLGELRGDLNKAEVILRHADVLVIDLAAIRLSDNLGCKASCTAGLTIEEMCQLAKYAGAGMSLKSLYIMGYEENQDQHQMMAQNTALIIWYFLEGYKIRKIEQQLPEEMQSFAIMPTQLDHELVFKKHQRTGRWWLETYSDDFEQHVIMACSPEDYEKACTDIISDRVLEVLAKA